MVYLRVKFFLRTKKSLTAACTFMLVMSTTMGEEIINNL